MKKYIIFLFVLTGLLIVKTCTTGNILAEDFVANKSDSLSKLKLKSPADKYMFQLPQPTFAWIPPMLPSKDLNYRIRIVKVPPGEIPADAIASNEPWFEEKNISTTSFQYPKDAPTFEENIPYAWRVDAFLGEKMVSVSEVRFFTYVGNAFTTMSVLSNWWWGSITNTNDGCVCEKSDRITGDKEIIKVEQGKTFTRYIIVTYITSSKDRTTEKSKQLANDDFDVDSFYFLHMNNCRQDSLAQVFDSSSGGCIYGPPKAHAFILQGKVPDNVPVGKIARLKLRIRNIPNRWWKPDVANKTVKIKVSPPSCPDHRSITNISFNAIVPTIKASKSITAAGSVIVKNGASVTFQAGQRIILKDVFSVKKGGNFKALIKPCN